MEHSDDDPDSTSESKMDYTFEDGITTLRDFTFTVEQDLRIIIRYLKIFNSTLPLKLFFPVLKENTLIPHNSFPSGSPGLHC